MKAGAKEAVSLDVSDCVDTAVTWSADGKGIVYLGQQEDEFMICEIGTDTKNKRRLSPGGISSMSPAVSPDGTKIAFAGRDKESYGKEIWVMNQGGDSAGDLSCRRLTRSSYSEWNPVPSPDGAKVALLSNKTHKIQVCLQNPDGADRKEIGGIAVRGNPRLLWSDNGSKIFVAGEDRVQTFEAATGESAQPFLFPEGIISFDISYSTGRMLINAFADGKPRMFITDPEGKNRTEIVIMKGNSHQPGSDTGYGALYAKWSPDGKTIAFVCGYDVCMIDYDGKTPKKVVSFTGNRRVRLATGQTGKDGIKIPSHISWSPSGDRICFLVSIRSNELLMRQLWLVNSDGSNARIVAREEVGSEFGVFASKYTGGPSFSHDGRKIVHTMVDNDGLPNLWVFDTERGTGTKLTHDGAIHPSFMPEEDRIVFTSLSGNMERICSMNPDTGEEVYEGE
jgi:Tol biopolymer transport system component